MKHVLEKFRWSLQLVREKWHRVGRKSLAWRSWWLRAGRKWFHKGKQMLWMIGIYISERSDFIEALLHVSEPFSQFLEQTIKG
ncbi:hypothetical protein [Tumebacillus flagellatus]|uniref:Uncharacterized protein n=1 Tax=Tumebacillus flagellatus TaxID=1157490 RepID=A0A074LJW0_9BACL|nr:hypothetical protein [Tumebacillus flagellatus]KEO80900.1 hypothetical protein EL26_23785 [Tumebacillus flagellatus]